ncbi:MAG: hypothetical protein LBL18_02805 [Bacteroidales bacterium]|jgi:hypothetical protein|nr:hypothetical protein [Bacteroidales bacterium]
MSIREQLRRDNFWLGFLTGLLVPAAIFGILYLIVSIIEHYTGKMEIVSIQKIILLSILPNLFLLRYYLLKLKYDLTGRGIVTVTFLIGILFAILEFTQ